MDRIEILGGEITKVVILLDREGRDESSNHIADEIRQKVKASGCSRDLYIGISDREIENWILSDETFVSAKYELEGYSYSGDGTNGKGLLKNIHGSEQSPIDKARALKATSPAFARMLSPSLASFVDQIDFAWHWAES
ncbi:MAG: hypothetical protein GC145_17325 [Caulobacter sp.]|nr:hypothetical protein [Caulobacter sp.]